MTTQRKRDVAGVLTILFCALVGGALLIATPFMVFLAMQPSAVSIERLILVPWAVYGLVVAAAVLLLRARKPWIALAVSVCLLGSLGWLQRPVVLGLKTAHQTGSDGH